MQKNSFLIIEQIQKYLKCPALILTHSILKAKEFFFPDHYFIINYYIYFFKLIIIINILIVSRESMSHPT